MKLIVGLGNPGKTYERTRHNAGFMVIDALARRHAPTQPVKARFHADVLEADVRGERCLFIKPVTYMNRSGFSVGEALRFYKLAHDRDLLVITDDLALPLGQIRLRPEGGAGGHNGLADISRALGTDSFCRLRLGIGQKPPQMIQADYVLSRFGEAEWSEMLTAADRAADAAEMFIASGINAAMNQFNARPEAQPRSVQPGPTTRSSDERTTRPASDNSQRGESLNHPVPPGSSEAGSKD
ncbi:MAG: aminoacyl-tRNA hydrolase [Phycisphaeraceae bacterium]|nr:aminoacyl-tRNA hydrolase [Phycisphaeraceae bacterium]MCW5754207.1 aminoacyl-tRNA hydrolase [Phycisphaeraceae bacterium]